MSLNGLTDERMQGPEKAAICFACDPIHVTNTYPRDRPQDPFSVSGGRDQCRALRLVSTRCMAGSGAIAHREKQKRHRKRHAQTGQKGNFFLGRARTCDPRVSMATAITARCNYHCATKK